MDISKLKVDDYEPNFTSLQDKKRHKVRARMMRDRMRENAFARVSPMSTLFETDPDLKSTIGTYPLVSPKVTSGILSEVRIGL